MTFGFWSPVENREGPIKSVLCVCVCPFVRLGLSQKPLRGFSETWHEVGGKKCKKRSADAFLRFLPVFSKTAHLCEKKPFLPIFASFWDFAGKIRSEDFR